jgi:2-haloacid dehalogenase
MATTLAFDVYGTLIDTHGVMVALQGLVGDQAAAFSRAWRAKQLEYSFRRGLMRDYVSFATCTAQALDHVCASDGIAFAPAERQALLAAYRKLPAFADVDAGLARAAERGFRLFAFSNGEAEAVEALLTGAGIHQRFAGVVSCDELRSFKPDPRVYRHFLERAGAAADETWLVSGNPFDVLGAMNAGLHGAWVRRDAEAVFDPWDREPTLTVASLDELAERIAALPPKGQT